MDFAWLKDAVERTGISWSVRISWPSAGADPCKLCGVRRDAHQKKDHPFKEE